MSLHVRGTVLPDGERRDLWVVDGLVRLEPVRDAITLIDRGFLLPGLVAAGVDTLEHGTGLTGGMVDEAARRGIHVTPTLINIETFPDIAERAARFPGYGDHMRALHRTARQRIRDAYEAGIGLLPV